MRSSLPFACAFWGNAGRRTRRRAIKMGTQPYFFLHKIGTQPYFFLCEVSVFPFFGRPTGLGCNRRPRRDSRAATNLLFPAGVPCECKAGSWPASFHRLSQPATLTSLLSWPEQPPARVRATDRCAVRNEQRRCSSRNARLCGRSEPSQDFAPRTVWQRKDFHRRGCRKNTFPATSAR